jgi:hypothetical protein
MSNTWMSSPFGPGGFVLTCLVAGLLTLLVGTALVLRYRRVVRRYMSEGIGAGATVTLSIDQILAAAKAADRPRMLLSYANSDGAATRSSEFRATRRARLKAAIVYSAGGFTHAGISAALWLWAASIEFDLLRTLVIFWAFAWPVTLTFLVFWGPDRRLQCSTALGYVGVLLALCVWVGAFSGAEPIVIGGGETPSVTISAYLQPLLIWATLVWPSAFLLVFLNRRVRNVGPVVFLFMVFSVFGTQVAFLLEQTHFGMMWLVELAMFLAPVTNRATLIAIYGPQLLGVLLFSVPAWFFMRWIAHLYALKRMSDQSIMIDSIWGLMTLFNVIDLALDRGFMGWLGLVAFAGYKSVAVLGLRPLRRAAAQRRTSRLLLLRVFGRRRHSERLFALISAHWRYAGSIELIAGVDLASTTLELRQFLDFLSGRLRLSFINDEGDLQKRLDKIDLAPDPDGRFRVNEFFCTSDAWQAAVTRLIGRTDVVLMDLRGFSATNAGCIFELQMLVSHIPLHRVVLLVDKSTDHLLLENVLFGLVETIGEEGVSQIRALSLDGSTARGVRQFLRLSEEIMPGMSPPLVEVPNAGVRA